MSRGIGKAGSLLAALSLILTMFASLAVTRVAAQEEPVAAQATPSADGSEITVIHAQGETTVPANPEVVIAFDMASVDTLDTIGVEVDGLPTANAAGHLGKFAGEGYINAGTLFEPDYEAVAAAEPDLIIVANRSSEAYPELAKIAPTIDLTASGTDPIGDLRANATVLGAIFGKSAEVEAALADIDARVAALAEVGPTAGTGLIIMTTGGEVTALAPGGVRGGLIYDSVGIQLPVDNLEAATHGEAISFEFLLEHNPDWLFVIDRDAAIGETESEAAEVMLDNEIMAQTTAVQNGQVVYLDSYTWYVVMSGLTTISLQLGELEAALGVAA